MSKSYPTDPSMSDHARDLAAISAGCLPLVGSLASALIQKIQSPLAKRQVEWLNDLAQRLEAAERFHKALMDMENGGPILDVFILAAQCATKTSSDE